MNWIPIHSSNRIASSVFSLGEKESFHITQILKKQAGDSVKVILVGEGTGIGLLSESKKEIEIQEIFPASLTTSIHLAMPLPRPQTGKKIFHLAGAYGIEKILFFQPRSRNTDFGTSPIYRTDAETYFLEGMSQTGQSMLPTFEMLDRELNPNLWNDFSFNFLFHTSKISFRTVCSELKPISDKRVLFVLGPESGFYDSEVEEFEKVGFNICQLGKKMMRTEYALAQILYEWELFRS